MCLKGTKSDICDRDKISDRGCEGAPDLVVEVISPSTKEKDYSDKLYKYRTAGVKEYWIIDEKAGEVIIYFFSENGSDSSEIVAHIQLCLICLKNGD